MPGPQSNFDLLDAPEHPPLKVKGKGAGIAGFVISLFALVFWIFAAGIAYFQAILGGGFITAGCWTFLSMVGFVLSITGLIWLRRTKGKPGLAISGVVIGMVALLLCGLMFHQVQKLHSNQFVNEVNELMEKMKDQMNDTIIRADSTGP